MRHPYTIVPTANKAAKQFPQGLKSILTAVRVAPLDIFKNAWEHFQLFWRLKHRTFSIRDLSNQNMYLRQNHDVFFKP